MVTVWCAGSMKKARNLWVLLVEMVAEGVETLAQHDYLAGLGCESFQGFLCSPGLPALQFEALMAGLPKHPR